MGDEIIVYYDGGMEEFIAEASKFTSLESLLLHHPSIKPIDDFLGIDNG